jgi:uncharacterized protein
LPNIRTLIKQKILSALLLSRFVRTGAGVTTATTSIPPLTSIEVHQPFRAHFAHHAHQGILTNDPKRVIKENTKDKEDPFAMEPSENVLGERLQQCGTQPMTGFFRDGYCNTSAADNGSHTVAGVVSDGFLSFSASRGNDLRGLLTGGCKWCLCASRWKESFDAWKRGEIDRDSVPKIMLESTHKRALDRVKLEDLKAFDIKKSFSDPSDPAQGGPIR